MACRNALRGSVLAVLTAALLLSTHDAQAVAGSATMSSRSSHHVALRVPSSTLRGLATTFGVIETPAVHHRLVRFYVRRGTGAWTWAASGREGRHGHVSRRVIMPASGTWSVRAVLRPYRKRLQRTTTTSTLRVIPHPAPLVIAHRGGSQAPENTLAAFRNALAMGVTALETDVQETSDGQLVLLHDETLARTTDVATKFPYRAADRVGTFTLAEIETLDAGSGLGPQWTGERIPTLEQLLSLVKSSGASLLVEAKNPENSPDLGPKMLRAVEDSGLVSSRKNDRVVFESFDLPTLRLIRELDPQANLSPIVYSFPVDLTTLGWADSLTVKFQAVNAAKVHRAHTAGLRVNAWTPDTAEDLAAVADDGVDAVVTNAPGLALATFR